MGARPAFVAKPRTASAAPARVRDGSSVPAWASSTTQDSDGSPVPRLAADSRTRPRKAIATPTEPSTTYFQAASRAPRPPREPTRKAVVMVVSSMATHIRPRLSATTARLMAARNRQSRLAKDPMLRLRSVRCGMPPQSATTATAPTTESIQALRASTRSRPPAAVRGPPVVTASTRPTPTQSRTTAALTGSQRVQDRLRATMLTAASSSGRMSGIQIRVAISRATPSVRRCRCGPVQPASAPPAPRGSGRRAGRPALPRVRRPAAGRRR